MTTSRLRVPLVTSVAALCLLTACAGTPNTSTATSETTDAAADAAAAGKPGEGEREVPVVRPRVLLADASGLRLLDAETGATVHTHASDSFMRLSDAGDGRHVAVADGDVFRIYDAGIELQAHGDHDHAYSYNPGLTEATYPAAKAGHVVAHSGTTVFFGDGDGSIQMVPTSQVADPGADVTRTSTEAAHHGVAVWLGGAGLLTTQGTENTRHTIELKQGESVVARTDDCPGVHGEAVAKPINSSPVVFFGCEDGPIVYRDKTFHKVAVNEPYARTGNAAGSPDSTIVLTDYKTDKDAKPVERPTRVALVDTHADSLKLVDLGSSYWFRSLGRGPDGAGLVLTYDGNLTVIDTEKATVAARIPAIAPWQEKDRWQEPGPILKVAGDRAYVTDAQNNQLVIVDLVDRAVVARHALESPAVEMAVVTGAAEGADDHAGHQH